MTPQPSDSAATPDADLIARVDAAMEEAYPSTPLMRMARTINRLAELLPRGHECERVFAEFDALGEYVRQLEERVVVTDSAATRRPIVDPCRCEDPQCPRSRA